jgi:PleD family two-component response regulator
VQGLGSAKYVHPDDYERYISGYLAAAEEPGGNGQTKATTARRILVVDDSRISADSTRQAAAADGQRSPYRLSRSGVYRGRQSGSDLTWCCSDIEMPKLNDYDACRRIRAESMTVLYERNVCT